VCKGDSGGPLRLDVDESNLHHYVQAGLYSYTGSGGCSSDTIGVFTDISHYKAWIHTVFPDARFYPAQVCDRDLHDHVEHAEIMMDNQMVCDFPANSMQHIRISGAGGGKISGHTARNFGNMINGESRPLTAEERQWLSLAYEETQPYGCQSYPSSTFDGKVALLKVGHCPHGRKVRNAVLAGAVGVIIFGQERSFSARVRALADLENMGPAVAVSEEDGLLLESNVANDDNVKIRFVCEGERRN